MHPLETVFRKRQSAQCRRTDSQWMDGRAHVMDHAGEGELGRPGTTTRLRSCLDDENPPAFTGKRYRSDQPVRA